MKVQIGTVRVPVVVHGVLTGLDIPGILDKHKDDHIFSKVSTQYTRIKILMTNFRSLTIIIDKSLK